MQILKNISLLPYNTFGIDINTAYFAEYQSVAELNELLQSDVVKNRKLLHIGGGSNLLFLADFQGVILHSKINFIEKTKETASTVFLKVGSGVVWDNFVDYCVTNNYYGTENLSLIPGEVGAAAVQNIGAYGSEISDIVESVETIDIQTIEKQIFTNAACKYDYRKSVLKTDLKEKKIVVAVNFKLSKTPKFNLNYAHLEQEILRNYTEINLENIRNTVIYIRKNKLPDPKIAGNAGSFFTNPYICTAHYEGLKKHYPTMPYYTVNEEVVKIPAAWLIEQCGWKGKSLGCAAVNEKQPLVLVNKGNATGMEILALATEIQKSVKEKFFIDLKMEVEIV
ncbi:MAG: UDP-N-acetylmuramate dehydrogenase [Prevotellaceae bacterium]|jgi:UDP-N-acetylmuramate dehydrogenase|nr:UDP-N-acetylmuramate dehydrogenase [Prevotellaceae bacterium]